MSKKPQVDAPTPASPPALQTSEESPPPALQRSEREPAAYWELISSLKPWPRNPWKHPDEQLERIAKSVVEFGWGNVVLARIDNREVIAGHGRLQAIPVLKKMWRRARPDARAKWHPDAVRIVEQDVIPVRLCTLDEARAHLLALADNKIPEGSDLDKEELGMILNDYSAEEAQLAGYTEEEYFDLIPEDDLTLNPGDLEDGKAITVVARAKPGDLWLLGDHRLLCGSSIEADDVARLMNWERADLMFTDPPYGVKYSDNRQSGPKFEPIENDDLDPVVLRAFLDRVFALAKTALRPGACVYVCHANKIKGIAQAFENAYWDAGFFLSSLIMWVKKEEGAEGFGARGFQDYRSVYEPIIYGWLEGGDHNRVTNRKEADVWEIAREHWKYYVHPTQKPIALPARAVENSTQGGDLVYEPFSGSGSTLLACEKTGRRCYAMEQVPGYVDAALARWEAATGKQAQLAPSATESAGAAQ